MFVCAGGKIVEDGVMIEGSIDVSTRKAENAAAA
jgi:hypothetical protein